MIAHRMIGGSRASIDGPNDRRQESDLLKGSEEGKEDQKEKQEQE